MGRAPGVRCGRPGSGSYGNSTPCSTLYINVTQFGSSYRSSARLSLHVVRVVGGSRYPIYAGNAAKSNSSRIMYLNTRYHGTYTVEVYVELNSNPYANPPVFPRYRLHPGLYYLSAMFNLQRSGHPSDTEKSVRPSVVFAAARTDAVPSAATQSRPADVPHAPALAPMTPAPTIAPMVPPAPATQHVSI